MICLYKMRLLRQTFGKGLYEHIAGCTRLENQRKRRIKFNHWMSSLTSRWKWFLVDYMIACFLMNLTSTWVNEITSSVLCLSLTINSLPRCFVRWSDMLGMRAVTQTTILGPSKQWPTYVFLSMQRYALHLHAMQLLLSAAAGVTSNCVSITSSWTIIFIDSLLCALSYFIAQSSVKWRVMGRLWPDEQPIEVILMRYNLALNPE